MNMIAYGGEMCLTRAGSQTSTLAATAARLKLGRGAACAGFSAMLAGAAAVLQQYSAFTTPADQAIVWVILTGWLLYWGMLDEFRTPKSALSEELDFRSAPHRPLMNQLPGWSNRNVRKGF